MSDRCAKARLAAALVLAAGIVAAPLHAAQEDPVTESPDPVDAIECRLTQSQYFTLITSLKADDGPAARRGWEKIEGGNPFLLEYELPAPITVAGKYNTRRIAFSSDSILAVLDLPDPTGIAREAQVENMVNPDALIDMLVTSGKISREQAQKELVFRKFLGERIISDVTDPPNGERWRLHAIIAQSISNVSTHPDKTLYGCAYRTEVLDKDGKRL